MPSVRGGRVILVGIATRYGLDGSGDRIPVGARFSAHFQTGPGAHPASCTMGTGYFTGVKRPGRGFDHPPLSSAEVEGRVELCVDPFLGLRDLLQSELLFTRYESLKIFL
jgi:hypothetical protein